MSSNQTAAGTTQAATVRAAVTRFLARYVDDTTLLQQHGLLTGGVLDSLAAVELLAHLERQFGITVDNEDLEIDNFDSVDAIVAFVARKAAA